MYIDKLRISQGSAYKRPTTGNKPPEYYNVDKLAIVN